ncbi:hypothetical protein B0J14DRAFT_602885 [Halenospora varia]|nr:hypothetical protein B0J14DRAFT_602885 [Halenospora varia]
MLRKYVHDITKLVIIAAATFLAKTSAFTTHHVRQNQAPERLNGNLHDQKTKRDVGSAPTSPPRNNELHLRIL